MINDLHQLNKTKNFYLGHVAPTKRCEYVITLAEKFFHRARIVGVGDLLVVAEKRRQRLALRLAQEAEIKFDLSFRIYKKSPPDLIWVDDVKRTEEVRKIFPKVPIIYSCGKKGGMNVFIDSREQLPLFNGNTYTKHSLIVGDYTTENLLNKFHIERKSPEDLYGTITKGHVRFRNELIRADVNKIKLVMYVECSKKDFINKKFPGGHMRQISGETLGKIIDTIENRYRMEVVWCSNRDLTKAKVLKRLKLEEEVYNDSSKMSSGKSKKK